MGGSEGSLTPLARRPAPRCYQPRPQTPIHGHFGGSPEFLGPPTPFTLSWTTPRDPLFRAKSIGIPKTSGFAIILRAFLDISLLRLRLCLLFFVARSYVFQRVCSNEITGGEFKGRSWRLINETRIKIDKNWLGKMLY